MKLVYENSSQLGVLEHVRPARSLQATLMRSRCLQPESLCPVESTWKLCILVLAPEIEIGTPCWFLGMELIGCRAVLHSIRFIRHRRSSDNHLT